MRKKMKAYDTFELWATDQLPKHQKLIGALRKLVSKAAPSLSESVKWGNGCWVGKELPVVYIHAEPDHLQFGFFGGSDLLDPEGLLEGNGKFIRFIRIRAPEDIDGPVLSRWIKQAAKSERAN